MTNGETAQSDTPIDLAREPNFVLGGMTVSPSTVQAVVEGQNHTLEPRIMQMLVALAKRRGEVVSHDELWAAGWGSRVVGEDSLYRAVQAVRRLGEETGAFTLHNVRRVGYRLTVAGDSEAAPMGALAQSLTRRPRWVAIGALLSLAAVMIGLFAWAELTNAHPAWQNGRVEVSPFQPSTSDASLREVASAFGPAIVHALAASGVETTLDTKAPDAEFQITGTVGQEGGAYATYVQVIDRRSQAVLWSKRFDRDVAAVKGYPESVANRSGDTLFCAMGSRSRSRKRLSPAVFAMFLNACADRRPPNGGAQRFFEVTRRLTEAEPNLSVAHSMHAVATSVIAMNGDAKTAATYLAATRAAADRALKLDRRNGEAYFAVGIALGTGKSWLDRESNFTRAAQLTPDLSVVHNYQAFVLRETGRIVEADALTDQIAGRDVFSPFVLYNLARARARAGDRPDVEAVLQRIELMDPGVARSARFEILLWWTDASPAVLPALEAAGRGGEKDADVDCALAFMRQISTPAASRHGLPAACGAASLEWRMRMLIRQGDIDGAYAISPHAPGALYDPSFLFFPETRAFRADLRFMTLARDLGLLDYWRRSGHWPDFCAEPSRPYDCQAQAKSLTSQARPADPASPRPPAHWR